MIKDDIRADALAALHQLEENSNVKTEMEGQIHANLFSLQEFCGAQRYFTYVSLKHEVDTWNIISNLISQGQSVMLPKVVGHYQINFFPFEAPYTVSMGTYGIFEPNSEGLPHVFSKKSDVILVPCLGFTAGCDRIGYGYGYFDTFLRFTAASKIGLAFEAQRCSFHPNKFDVPLDYVVTEKNIYSRR